MSFQHPFVRSSCVLVIANTLAGVTLMVHAQDSESVSAAAQRAFLQSQDELAKGNAKSAQELLKTAIRLQPANATYHGLLADAYLKTGSYDAMWTSLRQAARIEPSNPKYANEFLRMWRFHDQRGDVNVGKTVQEVIRAIGAPDEQLNDVARERLIYGFIAVDFVNSKLQRVLDLRGLTHEIVSPVEVLVFDQTEKDWKAAYHFVNKSSDTKEFTRNAEPVQRWTELLSQQRLPLLSNQTATLDSVLSSIRSGLSTNPGFEKSKHPR